MKMRHFLWILCASLSLQSLLAQNSVGTNNYLDKAFASSAYWSFDMAFNLLNSVIDKNDSSNIYLFSPFILEKEEPRIVTFWDYRLNNPVQNSDDAKKMSISDNSLIVNVEIIQVGVTYTIYSISIYSFHLGIFKSVLFYKVKDFEEYVNDQIRLNSQVLQSEKYE
jgi:hypothetical protein